MEKSFSDWFYYLIALGLFGDWIIWFVDDDDFIDPFRPEHEQTSNLLEFFTKEDIDDIGILIFI